MFPDWEKVAQTSGLFLFLRKNLWAQMTWFLGDNTAEMYMDLP
jgi:hypothetical protein